MKTHPEYSRTNSLDPYVRCAHNDGRGEQCEHPPVATMEQADQRDLGNVWNYRPGMEACFLHRPRPCRHCGGLIPWFDGSICDRCDRYADENGGMDLG